LRCGIYVRVSKEEADKNAHSASNQEAMLRDWATRLGFTDGDTVAYVDQNQSGGTLDRPQLGRLREDVANGYIDCILVYKLDRLSRDLDDIRALVFKEFKERNIRIYFRDLPDVDFYSANGEMVFNTIASMAHWQRKYISEVTSFNLRKLQERGHRIGRPPFGWRVMSEDPKDRGKWVRDEREMNIIRNIITLRKCGKSYTDIARHLSNMGDEYRPRKAQWWAPKVVSDIVKKYSGEGDAVRVLSAKRVVEIEEALKPYIGPLIESMYVFKINGRLPDDLFKSAHDAGYLSFLAHDGYHEWAVRQPMNEEYIYYWEKPSRVSDIIEQMRLDSGAEDFAYNILIGKRLDGSLNFDIQATYSAKVGEQVVLHSRVLSIDSRDAVKAIEEHLNVKFMMQAPDGKMQESPPFSFFGYEPGGV